MERVRDRYYGIDILKCLCAFLVVCIHIPFNGVLGEVVAHLSRAAVPCFFMITGFFHETVVKNDKEIIQIKKIFKLFIFSNLLYFLFRLVIISVKSVLSSGEISVYRTFKNMFSAEAIFRLFVFNESPFSAHLWYLGAILYVLILVYFLKKKLFNLLYILTPILLIVDLVFGKYSMVLLGREFEIFYVRNFIFVGIPYFIIGNLLFKYKDELINYFSNKSFLGVLGILFFSFTCLLENNLLVFHSVNAMRDHYISTTFLAISLFISFLIPFNKDSKCYILMGQIGQKDSTLVYIIHPMVITILSTAAELFNVYELYSYVAPIIVFLISVTLSKIYSLVLSKTHAYKTIE